MCSRLFGTIQWEGNHRAPVLRHVQHRGIRSAAHHKCPVNQNLVTIKANPQLGVRGTLAPPRDIRPRGTAWADLLEPQQFEGGWYPISDSAGYSQSRRLGREGNENTQD